MEKNEAFRKQVLSRLYGLPDPTEAESKEEDTSEDKDIKPGDEKETSITKEEEKEEETKPVKDSSTEENTKPVKPDKDQGETESEKDSESNRDQDKEVTKEKDEIIDKDKDACEAEKEKDNDTAVKTDHSNNNRDNSSSDLTSSNGNHNKSSSSGSKTITTPTTTTSHLYSVLMAPLDGRSPYRDHSLRSSSDHDADSGPRKRLRLDNSASDKTKSEHTSESGDHIDTKTTSNTNVPVGMDLTKNQKKRLKKKKRKNLLNRLEVQRAKDFIYSSENEQYSVEKLRTMIEDVTEFLDAIWDVYCSEARVKGESVEEDGSRAAAVLKCLSASGEGSWADLQLLSRAKSVLVLRNKQLAASTIARVDNELGYDADIRSFIVRMLKFWMDEIVTKG